MCEKQFKERPRKRRKLIETELNSLIKSTATKYVCIYQAICILN